MAANETSNRLFAAVKAMGDGTIVARSAQVVSVTRTAVGIYEILFNEEISIAELGYDSALDGTAAGYVCVQLAAPTGAAVQTFDAAGAAADRQWNATFYRTSNSAGL